MKEKILIVEDEFIVANDLRMMLERSGYTVCGIAPSVAKAMELIVTKEPAWILLDIFLQGDKTGIDLAIYLKQIGIPFIFISANTNQSILEAAKATLPYGFLVKPFREKDLMVMLDIAQYRHDQNLKYNEQQEISLQQQLEQIADSSESSSLKMERLGICLQNIVPYQILWIYKTGAKTAERDLYLHQNTDNVFRVLSTNDLLSEISVSKRDFNTWTSKIIPKLEPQFLNGYDFRKLRMENNWIMKISDHFKLESALFTSTKVNEEFIQFIFMSSSDASFTPAHIEIIKQFRDSLCYIAEKVLADNNPAPPIVAETSTTLRTVQREETTAVNFHGIIGNSPLLLSVFNKIQIVAPDDTSVLILGETGTGKERVAHTIHKLSPRKSRPMITVNCGALPATLIESELFGHEKGSFTGATDRRIGKFEQADGGSIFLDEIGELPLEAQVKILRVLQEKEVERLGGTSTKKIDVRIITATNRNLEKEVAEGRFRLDLYYRLNVFPIELPALRQRKEDIPLLVDHFITRYNKNPAGFETRLSAAAMDQLLLYDWPGNIRELEHLIERSILLSRNQDQIDIDLPAYQSKADIQNSGSSNVKTMEEMEREHILNILKICNGKIFGPGGAAEILNIPSTTLNSKIKKLGIKYEFVK